jgi:hypothetical protein
MDDRSLHVQGGEFISDPQNSVTGIQNKKLVVRIHFRSVFSSLPLNSWTPELIKSQIVWPDFQKWVQDQ